MKLIVDSSYGEVTFWNSKQYSNGNINDLSNHQHLCFLGCKFLHIWLSNSVTKKVQTSEIFCHLQEFYSKNLFHHTPSTYLHIKKTKRGPHDASYCGQKVPKRLRRLNVDILVQITKITGNGIDVLGFSQLVYKTQDSAVALPFGRILVDSFTLHVEIIAPPV